MTRSWISSLVRSRTLWVIVCLCSCSLGFGQQERYAKWDRFFFKPQLPLRAIAPEAKVKLFVYHNYPSSLNHLRITPRSDFVGATVAPPVLANLKTTDIKTISLFLHRTRLVSAAAPPDTVTLSLEFQADELEGKKAVPLTVPLTPKGERQVNEALSVPVGQVEVTVGGLGHTVYYTCLLCTIALLGLLFWRKKKLR